jgi:hypothetical protein
MIKKIKNKTKKVTFRTDNKLINAKNLRKETDNLFKYFERIKLKKGEVDLILQEARKILFAEFIDYHIKKEYIMTERKNDK